MALIHSDLILSEVIIEEPILIPVINRFGIKLGLGDKTIKDICESKSLDSNFFVAILNTFIYDDYFPEKNFRKFNISQIVDYLTKTNNSYERFLLPNIESHLNIFIERSDPANSNLSVIRKFFSVFKKELSERISNDKNILFPSVKSMVERCNSEEIIINSTYVETENLEEKLRDIKNLMIIHLNGEYDENLCYAVLVSICNLEKDITKHNRIRNKILMPLVKALESNEILNNPE